MEGVSSHTRRDNFNILSRMVGGKPFSVMYFNCRSLLPKLDELTALCSANNPDIVCLVETWLSADILDTEVSIPNYSILRLDRNRHGGGVALYICNKVLYNVLLCGPAGLELIVVSLTANSFKLCLGVFYRPPSSLATIFDTLSDALFQSVQQSLFSNFVILGDFNVNFDSSHFLYSHLSDFMASFCLSQVVESPTHFSPNGHSSLIDLVFVSNLNSFSQCVVIPQLANSDHLGLMVTMKQDHSPSIPTPRRRVWRYKHADFEKANELLCDLDLENILEPTNIQVSWSNFRSAFLDVMEQCIPRSVIPDRRNLPWLSKLVTQLIRKRNFYFKRAHRTGSIQDRLKFKQLRNKVVAELRLAKQKYFSQLHPHDQKDFWKLVKTLSSKESSFPTLVIGNTVAEASQDKANLLNATFTSYYNSSVPELSVIDLLQDDPSDCPDDILCTEDEVFDLLHSLDTTKASGHDDISGLMLKQTALSITSVVTQLFNISIKLGELPDEWKIARVSPIPKSRNKSDPGNYRPISLLSVLSKLLEKHIRNLLLDHLQCHYPLSDQQWGFTRGRSTTSALLAATDHWHKLLNSGLDLCVVFFDFSKAFDMVPHKPLLQKLKDIKVHRYILKWLTHYLCMRRQYVCVNGCSSTILPVHSGVPQGSILGPLLFIVYINDITMVQLSDGTMSLYADDIMLYRPIRSPVDYHSLQLDIDNLCAWTNENFMKFNASKCKFMVVSRKKHPLEPVTSLAINNSGLDRVHSYKYLDVWLTSNLSWSTHITDVCNKARRQLGILYRKFYGNANCSTLLHLYIAYVRPLLEYAVPVWDPHQQGHIDSLEKVQKFALRLCLKNWDAEYGALLQLTSLPDLGYRRRYLKLCFLYQVIHGQFSFPNAPLEWRNLPVHSLRSFSDHLLHTPLSHTNAYQFSFFPHTSSLWNPLPPTIHNCASLYSFKHALLTSRLPLT